MGYVMRIIKNQNYGQKYSGIERVQTRKGVGDGGEQLQFRPRKFAAAIPGMHPTNQQSLYRLIRECLKVMAVDSRRYDDRNRASHEEAKCIMEYLNEHGKYIPLK